MKRVIIVHGYTGYPDKNWFPWLKAELEELGVEVITPLMPDTEAPRFEDWLQRLQKVVGEPDEDTVLVGHSLGCPTVLRYAESLDEGQKIGGAVLVAGFAEPIHFTELDGFTAGPWDDERIKQVINKLILVSSDNDEHVPLYMAENMRNRFGASLHVLHNAGHINQKSGHFEVPVVLDLLKNF